MEITSINTKKVTDEKGKLLGVARVVIDDCLVIRDIRIIQGNEERGRFLAFPSREITTGSFIDIVHPITKETRATFEEAVLKQFDEDNANDDTGNDRTDS